MKIKQAILILVLVFLTACGESSGGKYIGDNNGSIQGSGGTTQNPSTQGGGGTTQNSSSKVLQTGQTIFCYYNYSQISCDDKKAKGQDGYYAKKGLGLKRSYTRDDVNNIVTDNVTKLQWQDDDGAKNNKENITNGKKICENLTLGGHNDWRLPTKLELRSLIDHAKTKPSISSDFKNVRADYYLSSTKDARYDNYTWVVSFNTGSETYSNYDYIRCVRGNSITISAATNNNNETVTDNGTNLMWQDSDKIIHDNNETYQKDAIKYCEGLKWAGYSDWRLPNINELSSIVDNTKHSPAIKEGFKYTKFDDYLSSTKGWAIDFETGRIGGQGSGYMRCVRNK